MNQLYKHICTRCIFDDKTPGIQFDADGVCEYCKMFDRLLDEYKTGTPEGESRMRAIVDQMKREGKNKKYDCIIGVSGGTDSSYLVHWAVEQGLRPLAVHFDNTWNTSIATNNIKKILQSLNVDLYTYVVDNEEMDDIYRAFFYADVSEIDAATDIALAEVMYRAANSHNIQYVLEGHSFVAEGITPIAKTYFDGKYISSIHKRFGKLPMKTFPNMPLLAFLKWILLKRIRKIRPLWYITYSKESARQLLEKVYDWQYYGGHHLESRITAFAHSYLLPKKFSIDYRNVSLAASVRNGNMQREVAINAYYHREPYLEPGLVEYFKKRLKLSDGEFQAVMSRPPKYWNEYPTYKKTFERLRPVFAILVRFSLVPKSFYLKYCFPANQQ